MERARSLLLAWIRQPIISKQVTAAINAATAYIATAKCETLLRLQCMPTRDTVCSLRTVRDGQKTKWRLQCKY